MLSRTSMTAAIPLRAFLQAMVVALFAAVLVTGGASHGARAETPDAFIDQFASEAITVLSDAATTDTIRARSFRRFLTAKFDIDLVSRFVLGRHWHGASEAQRAEYRALFEDYIVETYARRLGAYNGETLTVRGVRAVGRKDQAVDTLLHRPSGAPVQIAWRLRAQKDGGWRIIDLVVEGISLAVTQRSDFAAVIQQSGNNVAGLIATLRDRIAAAKQESLKARMVTTANAS